MAIGRLDVRHWSPGPLNELLETNHYYVRLFHFFHYSIWVFCASAEKCSASMHWTLCLFHFISTSLYPIVFISVQLIDIRISNTEQVRAILFSFQGCSITLFESRRCIISYLYFSYIPLYSYILNIEYWHYKIGVL